MKKTLRERLDDARAFCKVVNEVRVRRISDHDEFFVVREADYEEYFEYEYNPSDTTLAGGCFTEIPKDCNLEVALRWSCEPHPIDLDSTDWEIDPDDMKVIEAEIEDLVIRSMSH